MSNMSKQLVLNNAHNQQKSGRIIFSILAHNFGIGRATVCPVQKPLWSLEECLKKPAGPGKSVQICCSPATCRLSRGRGNSSAAVQSVEQGVTRGWTGVDMSTPLLPEDVPGIDAVPVSLFRGRREVQGRLILKFDSLPSLLADVTEGSIINYREPQLASSCIFSTF